MTTPLLKQYVEQLHLDPNKPYPSEIKEAHKVVADRLAAYPNGNGAIILLFKRK